MMARDLPKKDDRPGIIVAHEMPDHPKIATFRRAVDDRCGVGEHELESGVGMGGVDR